MTVPTMLSGLAREDGVWSDLAGRDGVETGAEGRDGEVDSDS